MLFFQTPGLAGSLSLLADLTSELLPNRSRPQTIVFSRRQLPIDGRFHYWHCHVISGSALKEDPHGQPSEGHESMIDLLRVNRPAQIVNRSTDLGLFLSLPSFCMATLRIKDSS